MDTKKAVTVILHAFVIWLLCDATMGIGMALLPMNTILTVHAIVAPIYAILVSLLYFRRFHYTSPLQTAGIFTIFIMLVDFFVVALLINKSMAMFTSLIGTWIPFASIFLATFLTGIFVSQKQANPAPAGRL